MLRDVLLARPRIVAIAAGSLVLIPGVLMRVAGQPRAIGPEQRVVGSLASIARVAHLRSHPHTRPEVAATWRSMAIARGLVRSGMVCTISFDHP